MNDAPENARAEDRSSPLRVIGVLVALLVIAGSALSLLRPRGGAVDAEATLAELFSGTDGAHALELEGARTLPAGETLVTFGGDAPIEEVRFVRYPRSRAKAVLEEQFQKLRFEGASMGGGFGGGRGRGRGRGGPPMGGFGGMSMGGPKLQDAGTLEWHGYEPRYARLRHTPTPAGRPGGPPTAAGGESGGGAPAEGADAAPGDASPTSGKGDSSEGDTKNAPDQAPFYDTIRVNLTTADQCLVVYVRFVEGTPGEVDPVAELLKGFRPRETDP